LDDFRVLVYPFFEAENFEGKVTAEVEQIGALALDAGLVRGLDRLERAKRDKNFGPLVSAQRFLGPML
jgi:hypothetical protein